MKKCLCFLLVSVMLLLLCACKKAPAENTDNAHNTGNTQSTQQKSTAEDMSLAHTYTLSQADAEGVKTLTVTDAKTGKTVQILELRDCEWFMEKPIYTDITFDGHKDILVPFQRAAGGVFFRGFVWNPDAGQYQHTPKLEELPNIALDTANELILSHRTASQISSYGMHAFNPEKQDFERVRSLSWESRENEIEVTEKGKKAAAKKFVIPRADAITPDKTHEAVAPYYKPGSVWDLDGEKWKDTLYKEK